MPAFSLDSHPLVPQSRNPMDRVWQATLANISRLSHKHTTQSSGLWRPLPSTYQQWLQTHWPDDAPLASYHHEFWVQVWRWRPGVAAPPFVAVWARGFAKSTMVERALMACAQFGLRRYGLYVCETQGQSDDHVGNVAMLLERPGLGIQRALSAYGHSKGWRGNRLRTSDGWTLDAVGLDTAARGAKSDEQRPDLIILDDIDGESDSPLVIQRKLATLTKKILPAGSADVIVLAVQNLPNKDGIFAQLVDGRADYLAERVVSGPHPAIRGMEVEQVPAADGKYRWQITGGEPTWPYMSLQRCADMLNVEGLRAFRVERQHEYEAREGALWQRAWIERSRVTQAPKLSAIYLGVDPPGGTVTECGLIVAGLGIDGHIYIIADGSLAGSPETWGSQAVALAEQWGVHAVLGEDNHGGDMVLSTVRAALQGRPRRWRLEKVHASRGKAVRAQPLSALAEQGRVHHVGHFPALEAELCEWIPDAGMPSPNRLDAAVWATATLIDQMQQAKPSEIRSTGRRASASGLARFAGGR